jgi:DNA-binding NarL/FixJ family response regulator
VSTRVVIADDQALVRTGFRMILTARGIEVVGEAADGAEAVDAVRRLQPDVVLMDIRMPTMDGLEATRRILATPTDCRVLILTTFDLDSYVYAALRGGASGFLLKDAPTDQMLAAVRAAAAGDALIAPSVTRRLLDEFARFGAGEEDVPGLAALTDREREVLVHMATGLSNAEIAATIYLGEATVKTHVGRVLAKLGVRDRVQAVVAAYEAGVVRPGRPRSTEPG